MTNEDNKTITEPLKITPALAENVEVGTIEDATNVDESIIPIAQPPVVSDEEAETYKNVEDKLTSAPDELDWETEAVERSTEVLQDFTTKD